MDKPLLFVFHVFLLLCQRHKPAELAHSFLFCSCVYFNRISFQKFSRQLSAFSPCSSDLNSALLVLSTVYLFMSLSQPWYNPLWLIGFKTPTNYIFRFFLIASTNYCFSCTYFLLTKKKRKKRWCVHGLVTVGRRIRTLKMTFYNKNDVIVHDVRLCSGCF